MKSTMRHHEDQEERRSCERFTRTKCRSLNSQELLLINQRGPRLQIWGICRHLFFFNFWDLTWIRRPYKRNRLLSVKARFPAELRPNFELGFVNNGTVFSWSSGITAQRSIPVGSLDPISKAYSLFATEMRGFVQVGHWNREKDFEFYSHMRKALKFGQNFNQTHYFGGLSTMVDLDTDEHNSRDFFFKKCYAITESEKRHLYIVSVFDFAMVKLSSTARGPAFSDRWRVEFLGLPTNRTMRQCQTDIVGLLRTKRRSLPPTAGSGAPTYNFTI